MNGLAGYIITVFMGFVAIMNPILSISAFLDLTEDKTYKEKEQIAKTASIAAWLIVVVFVVGGKYIFDMFDITIPAFKIAGGILVFYVGFEMLTSNKSSMHNTPVKGENSNVAISPLAIPILSGPGTIVTAMNFVTKTDYLHLAIVVVIFTIMIVITYYCFLLSDVIMKKLGRNLMAVITKLMGLILAILGTEVVTEGIKLTFHLK